MSQRFLSAAIAAFFLSASSAFSGGDETINLNPKLGGWTTPPPILMGNAHNANPGEGEQAVPNALLAAERSSQSEARLNAEQNQEQNTPASLTTVAAQDNTSSAASWFNPLSWWGRRNSAAPVVSDKKAEKEVEINLEAIDTLPTLPAIEEPIVVAVNTPTIPTTQTSSSSSSSTEGGWGFNLLRLLGFGGNTPAVTVAAEILSEETKNEAVDEDEADEAQSELEVFLGNPAYLSERFPTENPVLLDHIHTLNGVLKTYLNDIIAKAGQDNTELTDEAEENLLTRSMAGNMQHIIKLNMNIYEMMTVAKDQGQEAYQLAHDIATFIYDFILLKDSKGNITNREAIDMDRYFVDHYPTQLPIEETDGVELTLEKQLEETAAVATEFVERRSTQEHETANSQHNIINQILQNAGLDPADTLLPNTRGESMNSSGEWHLVQSKRQKKRAAAKKALEEAAEY